MLTVRGFGSPLWVRPAMPAKLDPPLPPPMLCASIAVELTPLVTMVPLLETSTALPSPAEAPEPPMDTPTSIEVPSP